MIRADDDVNQRASEKPEVADKLMLGLRKLLRYIDGYRDENS